MELLKKGTPWHYKNLKKSLFDVSPNCLSLSLISAGLKHSNATPLLRGAAFTRKQIP